MIERSYVKNPRNVQQTLTTCIEADKPTVFRLLATTEGVSKWFPQLSIENEQVLFDLGDGSFEKMSLLDYQTDDHIAYEWAKGKIAFQLKDTDKGTQVILKETLPRDFKAFPEDFTGWYVQLKNVKHTAEEGVPWEIDKKEIQAIKNEIITELR